MAHNQRPNQPANRLLACLASADLALLEAYLEPVELRFREQLESANRKIKNAYFIERGLASVVAIGNHRRRAEIGIVGCEGMTGFAIVFGADRWPHSTFMQIEGQGQRISVNDLRKAIEASASLKASLLHYAYAFSIQTGHAALANAQGKIEERLARWLLMAHDRADGDELLLTHEFLGVMLGTQRPGVTIAVQGLAERGLISTARGRIIVVDRGGLEDSANGLYGVPEAEYDRLFQ
jgi:CRP-like cAMP-binding protein